MLKRYVTGVCVFVCVCVCVGGHGGLDTCVVCGTDEKSVAMSNSRVVL